MRLNRVRYRKTACGWLEPIVQRPGVNMPICPKNPCQIPAKLAKLGAILEAPDEWGWINYTTKQGTKGRIRLFPE